MNSISNTIVGLELAQIGWVVPDINAAVKFLAGALGVAGFPQPPHCADGILRYLPNLRRCYRDYGDYAGRVDGYRTNAEGVGARQILGYKGRERKSLLIFKK